MKKPRKLLFGKTLFIAFISTLFITVLLVYLTGLSTHRSILDNTLISLSILASFLFLFLTFGLYNGLDVIDNYEHKLKLVWKKASERMPDNGFGDIGSVDIPSVGDDGIAGIIIGIVIWIFVSVVLVFLLVFVQAALWVSLVSIMLALYWIMIRGLKLIFSKSSECESDLSKSMMYASGYTLLYTGWLYGIILLSNTF